MFGLRLHSDNDNGTQEQSLIEMLQTSILRRMSRNEKKIEPIVYEFTDDRALLHQYYRLREQMYRKVFQTDKFVGEEDLHDKLSRILIARRGKLCIGGVRLTVREGDEMFALPMESADFKLRNLFPDCALDKVRHGEISRFAILDSDNEKLEVMRTLSKIIIEKSVTSDLGYIFAKSTLPMARNWRLIGQNYGLKNTRICTEVAVPENPIHPEVKWYLSISPLPASSGLENKMIDAPRAVLAKQDAETVS